RALGFGDGRIRVDHRGRSRDHGAAATPSVGLRDLHGWFWSVLVLRQCDHRTALRCFHFRLNNLLGGRADGGDPDIRKREKAASSLTAGTDTLASRRYAVAECVVHRRRKLRRSGGIYWSISLPRCGGVSSAVLVSSSEPSRNSAACASACSRNSRISSK